MYCKFASLNFILSSGKDYVSFGRHTEKGKGDGQFSVQGMPNQSGLLHPEMDTKEEYDRGL